MLPSLKRTDPSKGTPTCPTAFPAPSVSTATGDENGGSDEPVATARAGASPDDPPRRDRLPMRQMAHRDAVLDRRQAECALGHEIYLDPWIRGRSRFGPRS